MKNEELEWRMYGLVPYNLSPILSVYIAPESEESFEQRVGGAKNVFLREFLKQFKLA